MFWWTPLSLTELNLDENPDALAFLKDLLAITEDSYTFDDVVKMERKLLALHDFRGYNAEPMVFINRFVRAAFQGRLRHSLPL